MSTKHQKNKAASEISSPHDFCLGVLTWPLRRRDRAGISSASALGANSSPGSIKSILLLSPNALRDNASWKLCEVRRSEIGGMYDFRRDSWGSGCVDLKGVGGGISESGVSNAPVWRREVVLLADDFRAPLWRRLANVFYVTRYCFTSWAIKVWRVLCWSRLKDIIIGEIGLWLLLLWSEMRWSSPTCFLIVFIDGLGRSSGSSSEGVGNTLNGVLVELFLGVLAGALAGVATISAAAVDFLFLGDDRAASS